MNECDVETASCDGKHYGVMAAGECNEAIIVQAGVVLQTCEQYKLIQIDYAEYMVWELNHP